MVKNLADILDKELPTIIYEIARQYNVPEYQKNQDYAEERLHQWHQYGLLTHTRLVRKIFREDIKDLFQQWKVYDKVEKALSKSVGDYKKKDLFEVAILPHDLGKITVVGDTRVTRNHEMLSLQLTKSSVIHNIFQEQGLSVEEVKYIEDIVRTNGVVSEEIRNILRDEDNLNFSFINSNRVDRYLEKVIKKYKKLSLEAGVFFVCDTLAKTSIHLDVKKDEELRAKEEEVERTISEQRLKPQLKKGIMQFPLSMRIGELYLSAVINNF